MINRSLLFCATDAGGAKNISPIAKAAVQEGIFCKIITSGKMLRLFRGVEDLVRMPVIKNKAGALKLLEKESPDALICGTTRYLSPERLLISCAKKLKIRSIAVLDEWYNYRLRFVDKFNRLSFLPDMICCQDRTVKRKAEDEGLPKGNLFITGSVALSLLKKKISDFKSDAPALPKSLTGCPRPIITFISETHAKDYGASAGKRGSFGQYLGYTEKSVIKDIVQVIETIGNKCTLVEKFHPSSSGVSREVPLSKTINYIPVKDIDLYSLLWYSDMVIGMRSMVLLEAAMFGCKVVSYQPGLQGDNQCTAVRLRLVKGLMRRSELESWIKSHFTEKTNFTKRIIPEFSFFEGDPTKTILRLAFSD